MKTTSPPAEKISDDAGAPDRGYDAWKRAKIERGKTQAADRTRMIPAEQVWRDLKLER